MSYFPALPQSYFPALPQINLALCQINPTESPPSPKSPDWLSKGITLPTDLPPAARAAATTTTQAATPILSTTPSQTFSSSSASSSSSIPAAPKPKPKPPATAWKNRLSYVSPAPVVKAKTAAQTKPAASPSISATAPSQTSSSSSSSSSSSASSAATAWKQRLPYASTPAPVVQAKTAAQTKPPVYRPLHPRVLQGQPSFTSSSSSSSSAKAAPRSAPQTYELFTFSKAIVNWSSLWNTVLYQARNGFFDNAIMAVRSARNVPQNVLFKLLKASIEWDNVKDFGLLIESEPTKQLSKGDLLEILQTASDKIKERCFQTFPSLSPAGQKKHKEYQEVVNWLAPYQKEINQGNFERVIKALAGFTLPQDSGVLTRLYYEVLKKAIIQDKTDVVLSVLRIENSPITSKLFLNTCILAYQQTNVWISETIYTNVKEKIPLFIQEAEAEKFNQIFKTRKPMPK